MFPRPPSKKPSRHSAARKVVLCLVIAFVLIGDAVRGGEEHVFQSGRQRAALVELFSSQGCSSCPPADAWLNTLGHHARLWQTIIPVAFHVDYWDHLGWKDPFGSTTNSRRQRHYADTRAISSVYTPCVVINGREWRGWFRKENLPAQQADAGVLTVLLRGDELLASYAPAAPELVLNVAVLGCGLETAVSAGENRGRVLRQDFVVLSHGRFSSDNGRWQVRLPPARVQAAKPPRYAMAVWVTRSQDDIPLQATGGYLAFP